MPKELLSGTLEEQCDFLYQLAIEKMRQGNFTGAAHALEEIVAHAPDYADAAALLRDVKRRKAEQRALLFWSLLGLAVGIAIGSALGISNDLVLLLAALIGTLIGYGVGNLVASYRRRPS